MGAAQSQGEASPRSWTSVARALPKALGTCRARASTNRVLLPPFITTTGAGMHVCTCMRAGVCTPVFVSCVCVCVCVLCCVVLCCVVLCCAVLCVAGLEVEISTH